MKDIARAKQQTEEDKATTPKKIEKESIGNLNNNDFGSESFIPSGLKQYASESATSNRPFLVTNDENGFKRSGNRMIPNIQADKNVSNEDW
jgi:hypothetical protein